MVWMVEGSNISVVDLNPASALASSAYATDGVHQVGTVILPGTAGDLPSYPAIWTGTPESVVNLGAAGFHGATASAISGGIAVGNGLGPSPPHALLWHISGGAPIDLNPVGYSSSIALGVSHGQVVGQAFVGQSSHAAIWTKPIAGTFVDLNPGPTVTSKLTSTNGLMQAGIVTLTNGDEVAEVWRGTAQSAEPLPGITGYAFTEANAIDRDGDIVGTARNAVSGGAPIPVMWVPARLPGDANFDGRVDFFDLLILAQHYGQSGEVGFIDGDFNMDGAVDYEDLFLMGQSYGAMSPSGGSTASTAYFVTATAISQVPEPAPIAALLCGLGLLSYPHPATRRAAPSRS